jgi:hypothetical protein
MHTTIKPIAAVRLRKNCFDVGETRRFLLRGHEVLLKGSDGRAEIGKRGAR